MTTSLVPVTEYKASMKLKAIVERKDSPCMAQSMFSLAYNFFGKLHVNSSLNVILVNLQSLEWEK